MSNGVQRLTLILTVAGVLFSAWVISQVENEPSRALPDDSGIPIAIRGSGLVWIDGRTHSFAQLPSGFYGSQQGKWDWDKILRSDPNVNYEIDKGYCWIALRASEQFAGTFSYTSVEEGVLQGEEMTARLAIIRLNNVGSGGPSTVLIYLLADSLPKLIAALHGESLAIRFQADELVVSTEKAQGWEPNCCPIALLETRFRLENQLLAQLGESSIVPRADGQDDMLRHVIQLINDRDYPAAYPFFCPRLQELVTAEQFAKRYSLSLSLEGAEISRGNVSNKFTIALSEVFNINDEILGERRELQVSVAWDSVKTGWCVDGISEIRKEAIPDTEIPVELKPADTTPENDYLGSFGSLVFKACRKSPGFADLRMAAEMSAAGLVKGQTQKQIEETDQTLSDMCRCIAGKVERRGEALDELARRDLVASLWSGSQMEDIDAGAVFMTASIACTKELQEPDSDVGERRTRQQPALPSWDINATKVSIPPPEQSNVETDQYEIGRKAANSGDFAAALKEWLPLAEGGHAGAQFGIGRMYARGDGVRQDFKKAFLYIDLAAAQGNKRAQQMLSDMYQHGDGVSRDQNKARYWRERAELNTGILPTPSTP